MLKSRRDFIKKGAATIAGTALLSKLSLAGTKAPGLVGVQLYSIRDDMEKDALGSLKQVAAMGYKNVEHAWYRNRKFYNYEPKEFKKILDGLGLSMPSGHTVLQAKHYDESKKDFTDDWKYTVEDAATMQQKYVISPWLDASLRKDYDGLVKYMEVFNKCGELCKKSGMRFGYHNHDFEFSEKLNNMTVYDIIMKNTDPDLVIQQLDIGNLYNGGAKAIDIVKQYPGRFKSLHVKDEIKSEKQGEKFESTVLGTGIVSVKDVIDLCKKSGGTEHYIVEQESYQGKTAMDSIKEDLVKMKAWGY
jgi:sugar phosphate isomerase/epimerase